MKKQSFIESISLSLLLLGSRVFITLLATALLFAIIPAISFFWGKELVREEPEVTKTRILITKKLEKPKPKKVEPKKIRTISSRQGKRSSSSLNMKFMPDLGIGGDNGVAVATGGGGETIFDEGEVDEPPVPIKRSPITYPRAAKKAGLEGLLEIAYIINRDGRVSSVEFLKVPHKVFKKPIEESLLRWRFKPARMKGMPVSIRARQSITFNLDQAL